MTSLQLTATDGNPDRILLVIDGEWPQYKGRGKKREVVSVRPWIHPSLNEWATKAHRFQRDRMKKAWAEKIIEASRGVGRIAGPVTITVTTYIPVDRDEDIDNRVPKFILDGLKPSTPAVPATAKRRAQPEQPGADVIDGDGRRVVTDLRTRIEVDRDHPRTEVEIVRAGSSGIVASLFMTAPVVQRRLTRRGR